MLSNKNTDSREKYFYSTYEISQNKGGKCNEKMKLSTSTLDDKNLPKCSVQVRKNN